MSRYCSSIHRRDEGTAKWYVSWKGPTIVKKRLNDTNYLMQKPAKCHPYVVHVDQMWCFYSDLSKDGVQNQQHITTIPDNSPEPTGAKKPALMDVAKSDKRTSTSKGTGVARLACTTGMGRGSGGQEGPGPPSIPLGASMLLAPPGKC